MRHPGRSERMFEPGVDRRRKDQICRPELLDSAKPLKFRGVDEFDLESAEFDVAMNGVADEFLNHYGPKGPSRIS